VLGDVVDAVRLLLRRGLPVTPADADPVLLQLRGIVARAVDPADEASRTAALNGTLRGLLARFPDARYAGAARALFGLPPAEPRQNLTARRILAAEQAGHEVHHFRKRVEPKLIEQVAWELLADADRFTRTPMIAPRLMPITARQPIPADPFAWEVTEHEEQLMRLWSELYAARAASLAVERLVSLRANRTDQIHAAVTAAWRWATARAEAISYTAAYSEDDLPVEQLLALIGWTPALTEADASRLMAAAVRSATREQFAHALHSETSLGEVWVECMLGPGPTQEIADHENGTK
jgi:hypothetical protein